MGDLHRSRPFQGAVRNMLICFPEVKLCSESNELTHRTLRPTVMELQTKNSRDVVVIMTSLWVENGHCQG